MYHMLKFLFTSVESSSGSSVRTVSSGESYPLMLFFHLDGHVLRTHGTLTGVLNNKEAAGSK